VTIVEQKLAPLASMCSPLRGQAREQAILDAALELLAEIGYERVTMDAVASRAKASKATIYRKWPGKAELVAAALICHAKGEILDVPDSGTVRGDLLLVMEAMSSSFAGVDGPSVLGLVEAIRCDATLRDLVRGQIEWKTTHVGQLLASRATERGEQAAAADISSALGLAFSHLFIATLLNGSPPDDDARTGFVDTVLMPLINSAAATG
jgi:AcrR family transcriptional regulator